MFTLYDNVASVAAQKVRMVLWEKGRAWTGMAIDLRNGEVMRPEYLKLNPRGAVPTLVHDGEVITESHVIIEYLDELLPTPALRPTAPLARARMRGWMRRIDEDIHRSTGNVSMAIYIRYGHLSKTQAERDAYFAAMPDRDRAQRQQAAIAQGMEAPGFAPSMQAFGALIDDIDQAVRQREWLAGEDFSLAEIAVAPYITRLDMLAMAPMWAGGRRPAFEAWWQRVQARTSWQAQVRDPFPAPMRDTMTRRGQEAWPAVARILGIT
jgi:glutathione S-transferase